MKSRQFIRVENQETGRGMFYELRLQNSLTLKKLVEKHCDAFPNYYTDKIIAEEIAVQNKKGHYIGDDDFPFRFAFLSITDFEKWVLRDELEELKAIGNRVYLITATHYIISEWQAVFLLDSLVSKEDITDLFK